MKRWRRYKSEKDSCPSFTRGAALQIVAHEEKHFTIFKSSLLGGGALKYTRKISWHINWRRKTKVN